MIGLFGKSFYFINTFVLFRNLAFNKLYSSGTTVMLTPVEPGKLTYVVINQTSSNFVVRIINNTPGSLSFAAGFNYFRFNYFVIE